MRLCGGKAHGNRRAAAVAEGVRLACRRRDRKRSTADKPSQEHWQQPIHGRLHARIRSPRRNRRRSMPQSGLRPLPGRPIDHCAGGVLLLAVIKTKSSLTSNALIMSPCGETPRPLPCGRFWVKDDGSADKTEGGRGVPGCRARDRSASRPRSSHGAGPDQYRPGQVAGGDLRHRLRDLPQVGAGAGQRAGQFRPRQLPRRALYGEQGPGRRARRLCHGGGRRRGGAGSPWA